MSCSPLRVLPLLALLLPAAHAAPPYTPPSASTVLLQRASLAKSAGTTPISSPEIAVVLAQAAIQRGRISGDPREYGRAQAALARWWLDPAPPPAVRLLRATLRQQRHDFSAALADLDALIASRSGGGQALLSRASLHMAMGNPVPAARDCQALKGRALPLTVVACAAASAGISGQLGPAITALQQELAQPGNASVGERLWAETLLAELLEAAGQRPQAAAAYASALKLAADDPYLLATSADFWLQSGEPRKALSLLRGQEQNDALLLRIALAQKALAAQGEAAQRSQQQLASRYQLAEIRGEAFHAREQARFALELQGEPAAALAYAQRNWQAQREPADARLLMQAALASGRPLAAAPVRDWMRSTGIEDVRLSALATQLDALKPQTP